MTEDQLHTEESLLYLLLKYEDAIREFANSPVKQKHFLSIHQLLVEAIMDAEGRGAKLTRVGYRDYVERCGKSKMEIIGEENVYNKINSMMGVKKDDAPRLLIKMKENFVRTQTKDHIEEFVKQQAVDPIYAAKDLIDKVNSAVMDVDTISNISFDMIGQPDFTKQWFAELEEKEKSEKPKIICGIDEIDECMGIGFHPSTLTIICADVGGFKSTMMLNIALNVYKLNGRDVLFVPLEMPKNRIFDKIISRELRIPFNKFQNPRGVKLPDGTYKKGHEPLTVEEKNRVADDISKWQERRHKFAILETGERTKVSVVKQQILKHLTHHNPCLVVIDYIANLLPDRTYNGRHDLEIGDMLKDLIEMGKPGVTSPEGFAVLTGAQLGREALKRIRSQKDQTKQVLGSEDIQGSHQYSADATNIFGQIKDPAQPGEKLHLMCIKSRYGQTTFGDNKASKAVLSIQPDISLIESQKHAVYKPSEIATSAAGEEMLKQFAKDKPPKVVNDFGSFDDEDAELVSTVDPNIDVWA